MTNTVKHRTGPTKSQQMRAVIVKLQETGRKPRPVDIQRAMAEKGISVSSGHACVVLNNFLGKKRRRRRTDPRISAPRIATSHAPKAPQLSLASLSDIATTTAELQKLAVAIRDVNTALAALTVSRTR
jgi:hypothetical protein